MKSRQFVVATAPLRHGRIGVAAGATGEIVRVTGFLTTRLVVRFRGPGYDVLIPGVMPSQVRAARVDQPAPRRVQRRPVRR